MNGWISKSNVEAEIMVALISQRIPFFSTENHLFALYGTHSVKITSDMVSNE